VLQGNINCVSMLSHPILAVADAFAWRMSFVKVDHCFLSFRIPLVTMSIYR
jgi:hypothetical protein